MDAFKAIVTRRNIKEFKKDPIDRARLMSWLQTAAYAPNHRNTEPWEVLMVGPQTREKLHHKTNFAGAPILLAILSIPGKTELEHRENIIAASCFAQNFCLAAHADGGGTRWSSLGASESAREVLGVPLGYEVIGLLAVGYPEQIPEPKSRQDIESKVKELD